MCVRWLLVVVCGVWLWFVACCVFVLGFRCMRVGSGSLHVVGRSLCVDCCLSYGVVCCLSFVV